MVSHRHSSVDAQRKCSDSCAFLNASSVDVALENRQRSGSLYYRCTNSTYGLTYCFCFLTSSAAHVNINKHFPSFVHLLQMNSNSAWEDHRYRSTDIKCLQAGRWTKARFKQQERRRLCHRGTSAHNHSVAAFATSWGRNTSLVS